MVKKVQAVNILPAPSSSDEESSSSSEDEQHHTPPPTPKPQPKQQDSSSDDEEEAPVVNKPSSHKPHQSKQQSDDDSDETRNSPSAFVAKPNVPKPTLSKPSRVKARAKRPAESQEIDKPVSKAKKIKVSAHGQSGDDESGEVEEKKSIIKWSEKDEIALLDGIIQYRAESGEDVNSKTEPFYDYVKGLISVCLKKNQLFEKIKRLKKKFQTNADKFKNGEEPVFSRPHENKLFELSHKIWGSEGAVSDGNVSTVSKVKSSKKKDKKDAIVVSKTNAGTPVKSATKKELFVQEEIKDTIMEVANEETEDYWVLYPRLCASLESEADGYLKVIKGNVKEHVKKIINGMRKDKAREMEDGWKDIQLLDAQIYAKRAHLISKQAEEALKTLGR